MINRLTAVLTAVLSVLAVTVSGAQSIPTYESERHSFRLERVAGPFNHPWAVAKLPGEEVFLVSERPGTLFLVEGGRLLEVSGAPDSAAWGQGGLLDLQLSPDFAEDRLVYFSFSEGSGGYGTSVAQGRLDRREPDRPRIRDLETIYQAGFHSLSTRHFGSRLAFDNEGYLYVTLGERGDMDQARDVMTPYGSTLRLNPDGTIPADNPFAALGENPGEGLPEIWSYGHRNAQGLAMHPGSGEIWLHEHGPKGGDEVNILRKGADFGWPYTTHGIDYDGTVISSRKTAPGIENPLLVWVPSIAPSGMAFYDGPAFPGWKGNLFIGALAGQHLRRIVLEGNRPVHQEVLLPGDIGRIRDVRVGDDGALYLLTDEDRGALYRIYPD